MQKVFTLILSFILSCGYSFGQDNEEYDKQKLKKILLISGAVDLAGLAYLYQVWYADHTSEHFHFFNDHHEWNQMDKAGHFYSAFHLSNFYSNIFSRTGLSTNKSNLWGSLTGFLLMSQIELFDGFSSGYGASWGDITYNLAGSSLSLLQNHIWQEVRIKPKFSFRRSSLAGMRPKVLGDGLHQEIIKDYNGQTYWLSLDIDKFIPRKKFPRWINLAVGYGAENMLYGDNGTSIRNGFDPYRQYFLGIDWDLSHIKTNNKIMNTILYVVDMVRLPAPTLSYDNTNGLKFYILY